MKTSISLVLAVAASMVGNVAAVPVASNIQKRDQGSCNVSGTQVSQVVGSGGTPFCESRIGTTNVPISALTFFDAPEFVVGVQATYADGTQGPVIGRQNNRNPSTITVDYTQGQSFHSARLFARPDGRFTRHVRLVSSTGAIMNAGEGEPLQQTGVELQKQEVGNGTLLALQGTTSENGVLESFGFIFA